MAYTRDSDRLQRYRCYQLKKDIKVLKNENKDLRNKDQRLSNTIEKLKAEISNLQKTNRELMRVRNEQKEAVDDKNEIIRKQCDEIKSLKQAQPVKNLNSPTGLLDLPPEIIENIFQYFPSDEIVWLLGQTCSKMMNYALNYVWVIDDRIDDFFSGGKKKGLVYPIKEGEGVAAKLRRLSPECKLSQIFNTEIIASRIRHFVHTDFYDCHNSVLKKLEDSSGKDYSKKVLLVKNRHVDIWRALVEFTSKWNQLESLILIFEHTYDSSSTESIECVFQNSPSLKVLNLSGRYGVGLSIEGWNIVCSQTSNLTHVTFQSVAITNSNIDDITRNNPQLVSIDLIKCKMINEIAVQRIFQNSCALKYLGMREGYNPELPPTVFEIEPRCVDLNHLIIEGLDFSNYNENHWIKPLEKMMRNLKNLKHVDLSQSRYGYRINEMEPSLLQKWNKRFL